MHLTPTCFHCIVFPAPLSHPHRGQIQGSVCFPPSGCPRARSCLGWGGKVEGRLGFQGDFRPDVLGQRKGTSWPSRVGGWQEAGMGLELRYSLRQALQIQTDSLDQQPRMVEGTPTWKRCWVSPAAAGAPEEDGKEQAGPQLPTQPPQLGRHSSALPGTQSEPRQHPQEGCRGGIHPLPNSRARTAPPWAWSPSLWGPMTMHQGRVSRPSQYVPGGSVELGEACGPNSPATGSVMCSWAHSLRAWDPASRRERELV